ncbi:gamma-glutamylcyclotransferase family protein [Salinicola aestuarinus]|uniref:gamma-glutamylcyclotransferase family protein n=1 Tax=Salinicola aestuarinus TaxID=1949082 RepID=UPI000DA160CD|nr:gamma-glutamylcyclotransferase family protein [Salinicola aestuarinus]
MGRILRWALTAVVLAVGIGAGYFWYTFMGPYGYERPEGVAVDERVSQQEVFVYGTLRNDLLRWVIMGTPADTREATLSGYRRQELDIQPASGAKVEGEVLTVSPEALEALDRYERLGVRYTRDTVKLEDGHSVWVYKRLPADVTDAP